MKKLFTLIASALFAVGASAQAETVILSWNEEPALSTLTTEDMKDTGTSNNVATWSNGYQIMIMRSDKAQSSGNSLTIDEVAYKTIKVSNGAQNKLILPEGKVTKKITLYSYVNWNVADKGTTEHRDCFWSEVGDVKYTFADTPMTSYMEDKSTIVGMDQYTFTFEKALNEVTFTNAGEQCCYVLAVEVEDGTPEVGGDEPGEGVAPILIKDATTNGQLVAPEVVVDPANAENHCVKVASPANAAEAWDAQIFISAPEAFKDGDVIALTMNIKADAAQEKAGCQLHTTPGEYQHWQATGDANFTTAWAEYKGEYTVTKAAEGSDGVGAQTLAFNLSVQGGAANNLYFDDIVLTVNGKEVIKESFGDAVAAGIIVVKTQAENGAIYNLAGQKVNENYKGIVIMNGKKYMQK